MENSTLNNMASVSRRKREGIDPKVNNSHLENILLAQLVKWIPSFELFIYRLGLGPVIALAALLMSVTSF